MRAVLPLLTVAALTACSTTHVWMTRLHDDPRPLFQKPDTAVEVFASGPPQRPYIETAVIQSDGLSSSDTLAGLRAAAGRMGCDGLVITPADRGSGINHVSAWRGVCLVYPDTGH